MTKEKGALGPDRRSIVLGAALAGLADIAEAQTPPAAPKRQTHRRRPVVLVHDAWQGGWCWRNVANRLRAAGHPTYTPTLTGVGERAHLRRPQIGLSLHISDIAAVLDCEELDDAILVGHAYAGMVITGVADRNADRLAHVVYLDAVIPKSDQSMADLMPDGGDSLHRDLIENYLVRPPKPSALGVPESEIAETQWLDRRLTPHPAGCFTEPLHLKNGGADALPKTYIDCPRSSYYGATNRFAEMARRDTGWTVQTLDAGHEAMVTAPDALARLLLDVA